MLEYSKSTETTAQGNVQLNSLSTKTQRARVLFIVPLFVLLLFIAESFLFTLLMDYCQLSVGRLLVNKQVWLWSHIYVCHKCICLHTVVDYFVFVQ